MDEPGSQATRQRPAAPPAAAWAGGWGCILALAAWSAQLSAGWLVVAAAGAILWTYGAVLRRQKWTLGVVGLLWLSIGVGSGVEYQLWGIAQNWPAVERGVEERAARALNAALDGLVEAGEAAVGGAAKAVGGGTTPASGPLFRRLEAVRRETGVSAVAVFDARGTPLAWAGEHRGAVPRAVWRGEQRYFFHEGPLFRYVYFVRTLPGGRTAAAAVLLESSLPSAGEPPSFALDFARKHGVTPVFTLPERARGPTVWDWSTDRPILSVSFGALTQQNWWDRVLTRGRTGIAGIWLGALILLSVGWYRTRMRTPGLPIVIGTAALLVAPLGDTLGAATLFSPLQFVLPLPWDVPLGAFILLLGGLALWLLTRLGEPRRERFEIPWWAQAIAAGAVAVGALETVRRSATGGLLAGHPGGGFGLQLATTLLLAIPLFILLRFRRGAGAGRVRPILLATAIALAVAIGVARVVFWDPASPLPWWSAVVWGIPFALLSLSLPAIPSRFEPLRSWLMAGGFAALVALSGLWVMHESAKLRSAERELARLGTETDPYLDFLLRQFAQWAVHFDTAGERGVNLLYHGWVASGLAKEGYEARLTLWRNGEPESELRLSELADMPPLVSSEVARVGTLTAPVVQHYTEVEGLHYLLLAPLPDGRVVSVAVPPRSRLAGATPLARFLGAEAEEDGGSAVESLFLVPISDPMRDSLAVAAAEGPHPVRWVVTETGWRSEARAHYPDGWRHAHLFVRTSSVPLLLVRGTLVTVLLLGVLLGIWTAARLLCGEAPRYLLPRPEWVASFRGRVTLALLVFFLLPTAMFGVVAYGAVSREVIRSASGIARRALEQALHEIDAAVPLDEVGERIGTDLLLYRNGVLFDGAAREVLELGLFDAWLPPDLFLTFASGEDLERVDQRRLGENDYLVGYRRLGPATVLAAPIPLAADEIARRQAEFRDLALLMSLLGVSLSIVLSLLAGRTFARPIDELSRAAAAVGSGNLVVRLPQERPDEFGGVYRSFNRMVRRLRRARAALLRETRRTETIVAEAATGVLALDARGGVELVNPRAAEILGAPLRTGEPLPEGGPLLSAATAALREFLASGRVESATELEVEGRIVRLRMRRFSPTGGRRGAVVALEDVTNETRTARVLAWGEMARQIAHEIKNPLTPIKLAVQHLRRAYQDDRPDFGEIMDRNVESILEEIDRLGEIARAFSRFGTPQAAGAELEPVDLNRAVEETLALYRGAGAGGIRFEAHLEEAAGVRVLARAGELKEVLFNLLENARESLDGEGEIELRARHLPGRRGVELVVRDTGEGIPPELLSRIFEPHFSTRTSGTGLGLAIVRRMVESWGGEISAESRPGAGTRMRVRMREANGSVPTS